jgi:hypothetical protein
MNSARRKQIEREERLNNLTALVGWCTIASVNYLLFTGIFWLLANPVSTWFN